MRTFLFWNLNQSTTIAPVVTRLVRETGADVVVLAECDTVAPILMALNAEAVEYDLLPLSARVRVMSRRMPGEWQVHDDDRTFAVVERPGGRVPLIMAVAHLPSGLYKSLESRNHECRRLAARIARAEERAGHQNSIVIGDLNLNPFDAGVAHAGGLHAVMDRVVANQRSRIIHGEEYRFFYNPMWRFLGDAPGSPTGTYFAWRSEHACYFWNAFDQVLLRPALLPYFRDEWLSVATGTALGPLVTKNGRPDSGRAPDHLPIIVSLDL